MFNAGSALVSFGVDDAVTLEEVGKADPGGLLDGKIKGSQCPGGTNLGATVAFVFAVGPGEIEHGLLKSQNPKLEKTGNQCVRGALAHTKLAGRAVRLKLIQINGSGWQGWMQRFPVVEAGVVIGDTLAVSPMAVPSFPLSASLTISGGTGDQAGGNYSGPQEQAAVLGRRSGLLR